MCCFRQRYMTRLRVPKDKPIIAYKWLTMLSGRWHSPHYLTCTWRVGEPQRVDPSFDGGKSYQGFYAYRHRPGKSWHWQVARVALWGTVYSSKPRRRPAGYLAEYCKVISVAKKGRAL